MVPAVITGVIIRIVFNSWGPLRLHPPVESGLFTRQSVQNDESSYQGFGERLATAASSLLRHKLPLVTYFRMVSVSFASS